MIDFLTEPLEKLPGIGPKTALLLQRLLPKNRCLDLCFHQPVGKIQWHLLTQLPIRSAYNLHENLLVRLVVNITHHFPSYKKSQPYRVQCQDDHHQPFALIFFHLSEGQLKAMLPLNTKKIVAGKLEWSMALKQWQMIHPEILPSECILENLPKEELVYPLTLGVSQKLLQKHLKTVLNKLPDLPEWLDEEEVKNRQWPSWKQAVRSLHCFPPLLNSVTRLAYDELLAEQIALALLRRQRHHQVGRCFHSNGTLTKEFLKRLPFVLTQGQQTALQEIQQNMASPYQMMRLLQGDVGCGKTAVAMGALLIAVESGVQGTLLAPTEILARQHYDTLKSHFEPLGVKVGLFVGKTATKMGQALRQQLAQGTIQVAIGTHALLEDRIIFKDLGLVIIDEQHRFGVEQRQKLCLKGQQTDVLLMTATPIPRSLQLTAYGDLELSLLREKPQQRQGIVTTIMALERLEEIITKFTTPLAESDQIYWVCPLVEESEAIDLMAVSKRFETLQQQFGSKVAMVHGKMKAEEKTIIMNDFKQGSISILVATTVIEVGVDVPNATIMVIEHAERFGLAQLHQLRGRVGRGNKQGHCILLAPFALGAIAKQRLKALKDTQDGFYIADMDLKLRGAGETLGTRQSGLPVYRIAQMERDGDLIAQAAFEAEQLVQQDSGLNSPRGQRVRLLLQLFGYHQEEYRLNTAAL